MPVSDNSPLSHSLAALLAVSLIVLWAWLLATMACDLLRRGDLSTAGKILRLVPQVALPYLGSFAYIASQSCDMAHRRSASSEKLRDTLRQLFTSAMDELVKLDHLEAENDIFQAQYLRLRSRLVD